MIRTWPPAPPERLPSLGPQVIRWIHDNLVHGPGPREGEPMRLARLWQALIVRAYEVWPQGHPQAGRRRWKEVVVVIRKGSAKTEIASAIAAAEMHPEAPVRCVGWTKKGQPKGAGLRSPYVPMVAYTSEQSEDLAFGTLQSMLRSEVCPAGSEFSVGEERITRTNGSGECRAMAGSPASRDGARTTFQHFDEPHRMTTARQVHAYDTMVQNLHKVAANDAWSFVTSTTYEPGEGSLLEEIDTAVGLDIEGERSDTDRLFFELMASDETYDLDDLDDRVAALEEASGLDFDSGLDWSDLWGIARGYDDPKTDKTYWKRVWLGHTTSSDRKAVAAARWDAAGDPALGKVGLRAGDTIALGFDGSRFRDGTGLVAARLSDGYTKVLGYWQPGVTGHYDEVPRTEVHDAVTEAFRRYHVVKLYADPPDWDSEIADWKAAQGELVKGWHTGRDRAMTLATYAFWVDLGRSEDSPPAICHDGDPLLRLHVLAADRRSSKTWIDHETKGWTIHKPPDGRKIDLHVSAILAHEARRDAIAAGAGTPTDSKEPNLW